MKKNFFIGIDIGGTKTAVILASINPDQTIKFIARKRFLTPIAKGPEATFKKIIKSISYLREKNNLKFKNLAAIGISYGGPLDLNQHLIISPPNLPGWQDFPLKEKLRQNFWNNGV